MRCRIKAVIRQLKKSNFAGEDAFWRADRGCSASKSAVEAAICDVSPGLRVYQS